MGALNQLENSLGDLYKGAPKLPDNVKNFIVSITSWATLVLGLLQLLSALALWHTVRTTSAILDYYNTYVQSVTGQSVGLSSFDKTMLYIGIVVLLVVAVIAIIAFSPLNKRLKRGWDLLFLIMVINFVYAILSIFLHGQGFGSFIGYLIGTAIGLYFLFQIRDKYTGAKAPAAPAPPAAKAE